MSSLLTLETIVGPAVDPDFQSYSQSESTICQTVMTENVDTKSSDDVVQTVMSFDDIADIESDNRARLLEPNSGLNVYAREWYDYGPDKAPFYTSVPSLVVLDIVFRHIEHNLSGVMKLN